jgi:hypothetical protein
MVPFPVNPVWCLLCRYARDAASSSKLDLTRYLQFLSEFSVVPALCTQAQAERVFQLVNLCDECVTLRDVTLIGTGLCPFMWPSSLALVPVLVLVVPCVTVRVLRWCSVGCRADDDIDDLDRCVLGVRQHPRYFLIDRRTVTLTAHTSLLLQLSVCLCLCLCLCVLVSVYAWPCCVFALAGLP